jgi:hypothetical protein
MVGKGPKPTDLSNLFNVYISDNFHYMDPEDPPYHHSSYATIEAAIAFCKRRVDADLENLRNPRDATSTRPADAAHLYRMYCMFGEDPWISGHGSDGVLFSGWSYAKERCAELLGPPGPKADASPVVAADARGAQGWLRFLRWPW